jgi:acyl-CoA reductase-like NAD-dependent aldehyde dehydrogenase
MTEQKQSSIDVLDKHTGEAFERVASTDRAGVERAVAAAHGARAACRTLGAERRAAILSALADGIEREAERFTRTLIREAGKVRTDAAGEVSRAVTTIRLSAAVAARFPRGYEDRIEAAGQHTIRAVREPIGLCSFITPFNFPLNLAAHKVGPAIAVGCPFVLKPSDKAPLSTFLLHELLDAMPPELAYPSAGRAFLLAGVDDLEPMLTDDRIAMLSFTGSDKVGWDIAKRTTARRVALELGGDAACVIAANLNDDQLDHAASRVCAGAFTYAGQSCISTQRVIVHESIAQRFIERLETKTDALRAGDPYDESTNIGPLIDAAAADRVHHWIDKARIDGARIVRGGERTGNTITPAIITNAPPSTPVSRNEIFGPVVVISTWNDADDPVAIVNESPFGLQAGIFTRDRALIDRFVAGVEAGGVCVNEVPSFRIDAMPYGGVKRSGVGREGPAFAAMEMTELKTVVEAS